MTRREKISDTVMLQTVSPLFFANNPLKAGAFGCSGKRRETPLALSVQSKFMKSTSYHFSMEGLIRSLFVLLIAASSMFAETPSAIWPMPSSFPAPPEGVPASTYPLPRLELVQRAYNNNQNAEKNPDAIRLIFDGDSITEGWRGGGKDIWMQRYEKLGSFNFGIGGDLTQSVLWRLSQGQADHLHPKLIVVLIGTNNLGSGDSVGNTVSGVKAVVSEYQKRCPDSIILLQGIFPRSAQPTDEVRTKIKAVNQALAQLGDGEKIIFSDVGEKLLEPDGTLSREIMPDLLHLSPKGYQIWADAIQPIIDSHLSR